jgi:L-threonylcarbamoyladenylate synthase
MITITEKNKMAAELAAKAIEEGKVISFNCETVYGLAVDATNYQAVEKLYLVKRRQTNKPIAIFLKNLQQAKKIFYFSKKAEEIFHRENPFGLTLVMKFRESAKKNLAENLNEKNDGFLGFRIIENDFIAKLLEKFDKPIAVTSANISGDEPAINADQVKKYFSESIDLLIDGGRASIGTPSTVIKINGNKIEILRQGKNQIKI